MSNCKKQKKDVKVQLLAHHKCVIRCSASKRWQLTNYATPHVFAKMSFCMVKHQLNTEHENIIINVQKFVGALINY